MKEMNQIPKVLQDYFNRCNFNPAEIRSSGYGSFRVKSAYGPGDFSVRKDGLIENNKAGFIGQEEKVCYITIIDPAKDFTVVDEYII